MRFKQILVLLALQVLGATIYAQEVAYDYFYKSYYEFTRPYGAVMPSATFDKYLTAGQAQERQEDRLINEQSTLRCTYSVNDRPEYMSPKWEIISIKDYDLNYTDEIISSESQIFRSAFSPSGSHRKDKIYLVALPLKSGARSWTENQSGTKYNCTSEWAYLKDSFSYLDKVIKITKTTSSNGQNVVESFYWGRGYGLLWHTVKTDSERTIMKRDDFGSFSEITPEEFTLALSWRSFCEARKGVTKSILESSPATYSELVDELSNYVVRLNPKQFIYHIVKAKVSDPFYWKEDDSEWPSVQLKYISTVYVSGGGEISTSSSHAWMSGSKEIKEYKNDNPPYHWAHDRLKQCIANGSYVIPNEVEPISNKIYHYATKDEITVSENIDCFNLKIKKVKGGYKLIKGNQDIWSTCSPKLYLDDLFTERGKNIIYIKVLRFTCNGHTGYSLIKKVKKSSRDIQNVICELERIKL